MDEVKQQRMPPQGDKGADEGARLTRKESGAIGRIMIGEDKTEENDAEPRDQGIVIKSRIVWFRIEIEPDED